MLVAFQASVNCNKVPLDSVGWEFEMAEDQKPCLNQLLVIFHPVILDDGNPTAPQELDQYVYHMAYSILEAYLYMTCVLVVTASWRNLMHMIKHQYACNFLGAQGLQGNHTQQKKYRKSSHSKPSLKDKLYLFSSLVKNLAFINKLLSVAQTWIL